MLAHLGLVLWCFSWSYRICRCWRDVDSSSACSNDLFQLGLLRGWIVSCLLCRLSGYNSNSSSSVVFQWTISYMISPDAANLGVKAVYVWAGLLVPTTALLWFFYPEVKSRGSYDLAGPLTDIIGRPKDALIGSWTSCTSATFPPGSSRRPKLCPRAPDRRQYRDAGASSKRRSQKEMVTAKGRRSCTSLQSRNNRIGGCFDGVKSNWLRLGARRHRVQPAYIITLLKLLASFGSPHHQI